MKDGACINKKYALMKELVQFYNAPNCCLLINYLLSAVLGCFPIQRNQLFYNIIVARKPKNPV